MQSTSVQFPDAQYKPGVQCKDKNLCTRTKNQCNCLPYSYVEEILVDDCIAKISINLNIC